MKKMGRPVKCSTELKKCLVCQAEIKKNKNRSWPQYQKTAKFCSVSCGTKYQYKDGMSNETKEKISKSLKGKPAWNIGKGGYERPEHKKWMIEIPIFYKKTTKVKCSILITTIKSNTIHNKVFSFLELINNKPR